MFGVDDGLSDPLNEAVAYINITDDSINEANVELFIVKLSIKNLNGTSILSRKPIALCKILDDDRELHDT